jgi:hypothetical protein
MHFAVGRLPELHFSWFGPVVQQPVVVIGMGQLGALFSEGFLRGGTPVVPVLRSTAWPEEVLPQAVLVATGEEDLAPALQMIPVGARDRVILLQNELRPDQWQLPNMDPTVCVVWFEKKAGRLVHVVRSSIVAGPHAVLVKGCLDNLQLKAERVDTHTDLAHELVLKNLYILGLNFAGLLGVKTAGALLTDEKRVLEDLLPELLTIEARLLQEGGTQYETIVLSEDRLRKGLSEAISADNDHGCAGRTAPARLNRTLRHADRLGLSVPRLRSLFESLS